MVIPWLPPLADWSKLNFNASALDNLGPKGIGGPTRVYCVGEHKNIIFKTVGARKHQ